MIYSTAERTFFGGDFIRWIKENQYFQGKINEFLDKNLQKEWKKLPLDVQLSFSLPKWQIIKCEE